VYETIHQCSVILMMFEKRSAPAYMLTVLAVMRFASTWGAFSVREATNSRLDLSSILR
jgi:hypothetical protein